MSSRVADFLRQAEAQVEERREEGLLEEAEKLACDVLERRRTAQGKEHTDALRVEVALAKVLREGGKTEEATGYLEHALEAASRQGAACTAAVEVVAQAKKVMAWLLDDEEQYAESAPLHAEVLRWQLSVLGEKHRETLLSKMNIGLGLAARSFFTEACMPLEEALLGNSQVLGSTHLHTLASATNLAYVYGQLERFRDAEALHKETLLPGLVAKFGAEHPRTQAARQSLSQVLEMQDQFEEAEGIRREILQREASTYGALHPSTVSAQFNLAKVLEARGLMDQARAEYQSVETGITELYGKSHPFAVEARTSLERLHASTPNSIDS